MKTLQLARVLAVVSLVWSVLLPGAPARAASAPPGNQAVSLAEGKRLALKDGGYLTLKNGQFTLVNRAGAAKVFPRGSKLTQDNGGQLKIWGTGGTTIVGTRSFDDPLFRTKPGAANRAGAYVDPALPRSVNQAGAYVDPVLPGTIQPRPIATPNLAVQQSQGPPIRPMQTRLGYFHVCQIGYHLPNGGGLSGYLASASPVVCVR